MKQVLFGILNTEANRFNLYDWDTWRAGGNIPKHFGEFGYQSPFKGIALCISCFASVLGHVLKYHGKHFGGA